MKMLNRLWWMAWLWGGLWLSLAQAQPQSLVPSALVSPPRPALTVLVLQNSPYMSYRNEEGVLVGFNVEVGRLLCMRLRVSCEIRETLLSQIVEQVATGEGDIGIASLTVTPERSRRVLFTVPYMRGNTFWVSRAPISASSRFRVAAVVGSTQSDWVRQSAAGNDWTVLTVPVNAGLADALVQDQADAVVAPIASAMNIVRRKEIAQAGFSLHLIDAEVLRGPLSIALNPARKELLDTLNQVLQEIQRDGQMDRINSRYFPFRVF